MATQVDEFIPRIVELDHFTKPNVREMFTPDVGYTMFDADLKQADAQTVAWESGDEVLKQMFREGADLHTENAKTIYSLQGEPTHHQRQMAKHGVHATNFGASPRTMAHKLDMTVHQASTFQKRWFDIHPNIKKWQERIEAQLMSTRTITNAFGYRRIFFERVEGLLPEALAWIPQSTTVNIIDKGLNNIDANLPHVQLQLQVHDSIIGQFKNNLYPTVREEIHKEMLIEVPYDDPMTIEVEVACSRRSWGACEKVPFKDDHLFCPH